MTDAAHLFDQALRARLLQDTEAAVAAIDRAATAAPDSADVAAARAQLYYETWRPASKLFDRALTLSPGDLELLRGKAVALASEGDAAGAADMLEWELTWRPDWIEGHGALARIRLTHGDEGGHDRSYADACRHLPQNSRLWLAWFYHAATLRDWAKAAEILAEAEKALGRKKSLVSGLFFLACESGDPSGLDSLLGEVSDIQEPGLDLCRVRLFLRHGDAARAETIALRHLGSPSARIFLPYLSLIWRLMKHPRSHWLDGGPPPIRVIDLALSPGELSELGEAVRRLHTLSAPFPEQSVRGGTQTDRPLFFNPDPAIQLARRAFIGAVQDYRNALPPVEASHPLHSSRDGDILFEGSWSVRLRAGGFHASHTHVMGWVSSAFYVALPADPGAAPSGWLALGTPPPELDLGLEPYAMVEPRPGRLVLFPSTMWHGTVPFEAGERLTIAFDVKGPR